MDYSNILKAPTFSVKALVDLGPPYPPMKSALMMTIVKDCTMNFFIGMALKKYIGHVKEQWGDAFTVHPNHCAIISTMPNQPYPLPLDRSQPLREGLMELNLPYPFCLNVIYDPEYLRQKEEERQREIERQKAKQQLLHRLVQIQEKLRMTERVELESRERLQRRHWEFMQKEAARVLPIVYAEFQEIITLQRYKEQQDWIDRENDQLFFQRLRLRRGMTLNGMQQNIGLQSRMLTEAQEKQLLMAVRQLGRIATVEGKARERLQLHFQEEQRRLELQQVTLVTVALYASEEQEVVARMVVGEAEAACWRSMMMAQHTEWRSIKAALREAEEAAKRQQHRKQLQHIVAQLQTEGQLNPQAAEEEARTLISSPSWNQPLTQFGRLPTNRCETPKQQMRRTQSNGLPPDVLSSDLLSHKLLPLSWTAAQTSPVALCMQTWSPAADAYSATMPPVIPGGVQRSLGFGSP
eukprot:GGOE01001530.1.p1 GENE.GGOE01001530.1~~GGOE01001530.1.p1  ORF type:complete len:526 (+),score=172.17 GGOE01001530.1:183-1580(+)